MIRRKGNSYYEFKCVDCGKVRYTQKVNGLPRFPRCGSCANKNKVWTEEHKQKILAYLHSRKGKPSLAKGKKLPPRTSEHCRKISEALTGKLSLLKGRKWRERGSLAKGTPESPIIGDIRYGDELTVEQVSYQKYMFVQCPDCLGTRWTEWRFSGCRSKSKRLCFNCFRARGQARLRALWQDSRFKEKMVKKIYRNCGRIKPTKLEQAMIGILGEICPNEYKYVGDGTIIMGGLIPDFINVNGKKKVIEVFGDYWHSKEKTGREKVDEETKRLVGYKQFGFDCLIIWENEVKNSELVKARIKEFNHQNF